MAKLHEDISVAIAHAEQAEWPISERNGKIVIVAPDGTALTIGTRPNDESLKVWRSNCRRYNLLGDGPAMTPHQQEEAEMAIAGKSSPSTDQKKAAEIAAAQEKARAAAAGNGPVPGVPKVAASVPVVTFTAPKTPVVTPQLISQRTAAPAAPRFDKDGFPRFDSKMLTVTEDYSSFQLTEGPQAGRYFCGSCWERGEKSTFKAPQGLASHRGFRHGAFIPTASKESSPVQLPESISTAMELLRGALIEELTDTVDSGRLKELEKEVKELTSLLQERDAKIAERGAMLAQLEGKLRDVVREREDATKLATERGAALSRAKRESEEQVRMLMNRLERDLRQFQTWSNELAPVKAVGQIMDVVERYLTR